METLAPVMLDLPTMRRVVDGEGGCIVWGGAVNLSPADDILIRVERVLDIDSRGQMVASVLSKKIAAGATNVLIDIPVGPTAKVRTATAGEELGSLLQKVGGRLGLEVRTHVSDGSVPIGYGIGPALEAHDVLAVFNGDASAPDDLRVRALELAGHLLEMGGVVAAGGGFSLAEQTLRSGQAWRKFQAICAAQGGMRAPPVARHQRQIFAERDGYLHAIDNRTLARLAKLAGAPAAAAAGIYLHVRRGQAIQKDQPLFTLHAESAGELAYAVEYYRSHRDVLHVTETAQ
jgi:thymidine phosphorylase